jgi:hypothetical protein
MAIIAASAWLDPGLLALIPPLKVLHSTMRSAYDSVKPPVDEVLEVLHGAADAVQSATPDAADAVASDDMAGKPVNGGFAVSSSRNLPVEDDAFPELCGRAGDEAIDLAQTALGPFGALLGPLHDPMHSLADDFSAWFCGDSKDGPPTRTEHRAVVHPIMPWNIACQNEDLPLDFDTPRDKRESPKCKYAHAKDEQALPDGETGECQPQYDCSFGGPYDQVITRARVECDPSSQPAPIKYSYQQRRGHVVYTWEKAVWKRGEPIYSTPELKNDEGALPCTARPILGVKRNANYNRVVHPSNDPSAVLPVCSDESEPPPLLRPGAGMTQEVDFTEVRQVFKCQKMEDIPVKVSDAKPEGDGGDERAPKKVKDHTELGSESFQIRSVMQGDLQALGVSQIVRFALWNQTPPDDAHPILRALGGYSTAQAEYFFDGKDARTEWMWEMRWRARLRRFHVPLDSGFGSFSFACGTGLGVESCASLLVNLGLAGDGAH